MHAMEESNFTLTLLIAVVAINRKQNEYPLVNEEDC